MSATGAPARVRRLEPDRRRRGRSRRDPGHDLLLGNSRRHLRRGVAARQLADELVGDPPLVAALYGPSTFHIGVVGQVTPFTIHLGHHRPVISGQRAGYVPGVPAGRPGRADRAASNALPGPAVWHGGRLAFACRSSMHAARRFGHEGLRADRGAFDPANPNNPPSVRQDVLVSEKDSTSTRAVSPTARRRPSRRARSRPRPG